MTTLREALATIEAADPAELLRAEMHRAVRDVDFRQEVARKPPQPSAAGMDPRNAEVAARMQRSQAEQAERERRWAEQRRPDREEIIRRLSAGQAPGAAAAIRASILSGGG